jgi:hypothetical protein
VKEQILTLEPTDDLPSLRDKIARAQAGRLVLLWPILHKPLSRRLDVILMRRWAAAAGSYLIIVSADRSVRRLAREAGAPCYPSLEASTTVAPDSRKPYPLSRIPQRPRGHRPNPPPRRSPVRLHWAARISIFAAAILSLGAAALLAVPSARITATFPSRNLKATLPFDSLRCSPLSLRISLSDRRATTGRALTPTSFAEGDIRLTNTTDHGLNLPAGIRVSSDDGTAFETLQGILLASGQSQMVAARAVEAGPAGNLPVGALRVVEGPLGFSLEATNPAATTGGASQWRATVTENDLEILRVNLMYSLLLQAETGLLNLTGANQKLVNGSMQLEFDPQDKEDIPAGTPADTVGMTLHASATALACPNDALAEAARNALTVQLLPGETLFADKIVYTVSAVSAGSSGALILQTSGKAVRVPDPQDVQLALRLRTPAQAEALLRERFGAVGDTTIVFNPPWLPVLPLYPLRMEFLAQTD